MSKAMNPQEQQSLENFLKQLVQAPTIAKHPQADAMIQAAIAKQPDAAYLLVQRAMLLEQALEQAKAQAGGNSFLPRNNPWTASGGAAMPQAAPHSAPAASWAAPQAQAATGGASSFLGSVATTAAGVVAGSFLFQGLEHMMHPQHGGGWMSDNGAMGRESITENTVVNNYYGDAQPQADANLADFANDVDDSADFGDDSTWI